jgi:hypothetical protein
MATTELKGRHEKEEKTDTSMDAIMNHLNNYGNQLREYLDHVEAKVEGYKFAVEKKENGVTIDASFRAFVRPREME